MKTEKRAKTIKPYGIFFKGYGITIPTGSTVSNSTACGHDDSYRFWLDFHKLAEELTWYKRSMLAHDLTYYGINIPAEYCEPWIKP